MNTRFDHLLGLNELSTNSGIWRAAVAELLGTMILVLIGCATCVQIDEKQSVLHVALTFGIVLATLVQAFGHVSGCHVNPAVTIAMMLTGKTSFFRALVYVASQLIGSIAGSGILYGLTRPRIETDLGVTRLERVTEAQGFGVEFFATFIFVLVIFGVTDEHRKDIHGSRALAIGLALAAGILGAGQFTGGSLNPARSFGPAVVSNDWADHWIYWVGPIAGGLAAGIVYQNFFHQQNLEPVSVVEANRDIQAQILGTTEEEEQVPDPTTMV